jgi:hypothetical protein
VSGFVRLGTWGKWLRGCPPACGLLLDAAAPLTPSAGAAIRAGVPQAWIPAFAGMTVRAGMTRGTEMTKGARRIRSVARSAQRHQGGARRAGDSRGAECAADLSPRSRSLKQEERETIVCHDLNPPWPRSAAPPRPTSWPLSPSRRPAWADPCGWLRATGRQSLR